jgi:hypothetical protein
MLRAKDILAKLNEMSGPDSEVSDLDYGNNDFDYFPELTTRVYNGQDDVASLAAQTSIGYEDEVAEDPLDGEYDDYDDEGDYYDDEPSPSGEEPSPSGEEPSGYEPSGDYDLYAPDDDYTYDDFDMSVTDYVPTEDDTEGY